MKRQGEEEVQVAAVLPIFHEYTILAPSMGHHIKIKFYTSYFTEREHKIQNNREIITHHNKTQL